MKAKEFLIENRELVINYYNTEVKGLWIISLADFMKDVLVNFKKITTGDELKKFDLFGNLQDAKSRLGLFTVYVAPAEDKKRFNHISDNAQGQLPSSMR
jgi:hypothetical protein